MFSALTEFGWKPIKEKENIIGLNKEEINCVKTFFYQNIIDFVSEKTVAISLA